MSLKRLIILPALIPFVTIPVLQRNFKTTVSLPKEEIKPQEQESIPPWKQHLQRECISFSELSETIFVCKPSSQGDTSPFFFYARFRYEDRKRENPSSILFSVVQELRYDKTTEELVVKYLGEKEARISEFPEAFKKLEDRSIVPNKNCRWGKTERSFECQFSADESYLDIFFVRH